MNPTERRQFLRWGALAFAAPLAARLGLPAAQAQALPKLPLDHPQALPKLPLDHPQAKALAYVEDAARSTHASFKPGSHCANCQFFTAANGACTLFPGFSVPAAAWCAAWAKKA